MTSKSMKPKTMTHGSIMRGVDILHSPRFNKGTAFNDEERDALDLHGLLPPRPSSMDEQIMRVLENFDAKKTDLEKFIHMTALHDRNETLFFRVIVDHVVAMMPIIYTPTVGKACQQFGHIFRRARGMFICRNDRGRVRKVLANWQESDVRAIVVTDGERILGLGDLGANGMGIPIGKLALYTACAGVHPARTLPVTIDIGTNNEALLADPLYLGTHERRLTGDAYDELVEEFVTAANELWPGVLIQFEDFGNANAFRLLRRYRDRVCTFNDDIQGTASVTLAGVMSALRVTGGKLEEQMYLFLGAGEAGTGIADLLVTTMVANGLSLEDARRRCWFVDSKGLVVKSRANLQEHKIAYAHDTESAPDLESAIQRIKPTALIGVSGQPSTFTPAVLEAMAALNEKPIVFALSNPTSQAECTAEEAYRHTGGRAIFASGSPFNPVTIDGRRHVPGQANNAYVFPGIALGVIASRARHVTDEMFFTAARVLADQVGEDLLATGLLFPPLERIRDVSFEIAMAVADVAFERDLAAIPRPRDLAAFVAEKVYEPVYMDYV